MNENINKRVLIVGCPRSGTTLLQSMLASHCDVLSFPETHFLQFGIGRNGTQVFAPFGRIKQLNSIFLEIHNKKAVNNILDAVRIFLSSKYFVGFVVHLMDNVCLENKRNIWVEKTPEHLFYVDYVHSMAPETKIIHMVRDGGPVVISIVEMWNEYMRDWSVFRKSLTYVNDIYRTLKCYSKYVSGFKVSLLWKMLQYRKYVRASELWNDAILETKKFIGRSNHCICFYENLTSRPVENARNIATFLDISFSISMLQPELSSRVLIRQNETWKNDNLSKIRSASSNKFDSLPAEVRELIRTILVASGSGHNAIYGK